MSSPEPAPPPDNPAPHFAQQFYPYAYRPRETEGFAIASLALSVAAVPGLCAYGIGALFAVIGAIMGHVARRRIATRGTDGSGLALAGIIIGWTTTALVVAGIAILVVLIVVSESDPRW